jgi:hypothetical protein
VWGCAVVVGVTMPPRRRMQRLLFLGRRSDDLIQVDSIGREMGIITGPTPRRGVLRELLSDTMAHVRRLCSVVSCLVPHLFIGNRFCLFVVGGFSCAFGGESAVFIIYVLFFFRFWARAIFRDVRC